VELKDVLENAEVLDAGSGKIKTFSNKDCRFGYRDSIFKNTENLIILNLKLKLLSGSTPNVKYPDLAKMFEGKKSSIVEVRNAVMETRKRKLHYGDVGNAGSFFKNPVVSEVQFNNLKSNHPELKGFDQGGGLIKLSAAQLIEKCGWKGKTRGSVGVSEKHSLVLINYGKGTAEEIIGLAGDIKTTVKDEFGVVLEREVEVIDN